MFLTAHLPYNQTHAFGKIVLDYLNGSENLKPFYSLQPSVKSIEKTLQRKKQQTVNRQKLVEVLQTQYQTVPVKDEVKKNIEALLSENTFTVCTAHQPNLFTGP